MRQLRPANQLRELVRQQVQLGRHEVQLGARRERAEHVERGQVEVQRRMTGDAVRRRRAEERHRPFDERPHVGVRDHHAFGRAGRSRRKEDVRAVSRAVLVSQGLGRIARQVARGKLRLHPARGRRGVEPPDRVRPRELRRGKQPLERRADGSARQDPAVVARRDHLLGAGRGTPRVEGHVHRIGLERREDGDDRLGRLGAQQAHPVAPRASGVLEEARQPVAAGLELAVGDAPLLEHERPGVGASSRLLGHPVLQQATHGVTRAAARSHTTPMCSNSSGLAGTSRMIVR